MYPITPIRAEESSTIKEQNKLAAHTILHERENNNHKKRKKVGYCGCAHKEHMVCHLQGKILLALTG